MEPSWSGDRGRGGVGKVKSGSRPKKKKREGGESELFFVCARGREAGEWGGRGGSHLSLLRSPPLPSPSRFQASPIVFCSLLLPRCLFFPLQVLFFRGSSSGRNRDKVSRGERRPYVAGCSAVQQLERGGGGGPKEPHEARRALRRAGEGSPPPYVAAWGDTAGLRVTGIYDDCGRKGGRGFLVFPHFSSSFSPPLLPASKSAPGKR